MIGETPILRFGGLHSLCRCTLSRRLLKRLQVFWQLAGIGAFGEKLYAARYSSEGNSRSLYMSRHLDAIEEQLDPGRRDVLERMGPSAP